MGYRFGSFNIQKFNAFSKDGNKDLRKIAEIITSGDMDIVAIQEIFNKKSMELLLDNLNSEKREDNWTGEHANPPSRSVNAAEGYAFLWRKRTITNVGGAYVNGAYRQGWPRIFNQYKIDRRSGQQEIVRNPFYGRFLAKGLNPSRAKALNTRDAEDLNTLVEFRLINTHIMWSKTNSDEDENYVNPSAVIQRKLEFDVLAKTVYPKIFDRQYSGGRNSYFTIMLGDYNLNLNRFHTRYPYVEENIFFEGGTTCKELLTCQDQLTTLKRDLPEHPMVNTEEYFSNNYDHFTYEKNRFSGCKVKVERLDGVIRKLFNENISQYKRTVSDHLPIVIDVELNNKR